MIKYKLTDREYKTYGDTQWGEGVLHITNGKGELCGPGWIHVYGSPELAVLLNPIHADYIQPVLWECECSGQQKNDYGLKSGFTEVRTMCQIELPELKPAVLVGFAILCALEVYKEKSYVEWAEAWLSGSNRTYDGAWNTRVRARKVERTDPDICARFRAKAAGWAADVAESYSRNYVEPIESARIARLVSSILEEEPLDLIAIAKKAFTVQTISGPVPLFVKRKDFRQNSTCSIDFIYL